MKYLSPLYKENRFYSSLPYKYQWYLEKDYNQINDYFNDDFKDLEEFYNNLDILPELIYDVEKEDFTIKFKIKKVF